ncbi:MAG: sel1 repeat family protein [Candidatus Methanomethylophilaceae archaeon]|nr:sel1 repeat family protein [Candidatus Methanomethylophilaceae archaeon]
MAHRDRKDGLADLDAAAEWMRKAAGCGLAWAHKELFDILWMMGTPDSLAEMASRAFARAEAGDAEMMGLLGRAFKEGKGVDQSLESAESWLKKSADGKCLWAKDEYFDLLWEIGTPESLAKMAEFGKSEYKNNPSMMARMGRAYCRGRGVEKDIPKAVQLLRSSLEKGPRWAKAEYIDALIQVGTAESKRDAFDYTRSILEEDRGDAYARIACMYRDGIGTRKSLRQACDNFRKAAEKRFPASRA